MYFTSNVAIHVYVYICMYLCVCMHVCTYTYSKYVYIRLHSQAYHLTATYSDL